MWFLRFFLPALNSIIPRRDSRVILLVAGGLSSYKRRETPAASPQRMLTRITFDDGLQNEPTWSPDDRYIAYSSDRGGKFDIWVQQVSGGDPCSSPKSHPFQE